MNWKIYVCKGTTAPHLTGEYVSRRLAAAALPAKCRHVYRDSANRTYIVHGV